MSALRSNDNFQVVVKYLANCLQQTEQDMRKCADEVRLRWLQGGAQDIEEFLHLIEQSKRL